MPSALEMVEYMEYRDELDSDMNTKDAREGILGAIRATMSGELTMPDPSSMCRNACWPPWSWGSSLSAGPW